MPEEVLTSLVHGMATARRSQELNSCAAIPSILPRTLAPAADGFPWCSMRRAQITLGNMAQGETALVEAILGDDPVAIPEAIKDAIRGGRIAGGSGSAVAHAAFVRMARFRYIE